MKIVHLANQSRSNAGISQGLLHFTQNLILSCSLMSFGKQILPATKDLDQHLDEADFIFIGDLNAGKHKDYIEKKQLWKKVIYYDYRDTTAIDKELLEKSRVYFKRSLTEGVDRKLVVLDNRVIPLWHCALDEYYQIKQPQQHEVGCFFDFNDPQHLGKRRLNLMETITKRQWNNSLIGTSTGKKQAARLAVRDPKKDNCFAEFLGLQSSCKIVITAQPTHCEGDNRTWEALASGAMVVMDKTYHPLLHKPQNGHHCLIYDANNVTSIEIMLDKVEWYLSNENARKEIADRGYEHTRQFHLPKNRVEYMFHNIGFKTL